MRTLYKAGVFLDIPCEHACCYTQVELVRKLSLAALAYCRRVLVTGKTLTCLMQKDTIQIKYFFIEHFGDY